MEMVKSALRHSRIIKPMLYLSADACFFPEMQICILDKFLPRTTKRRKMKSGNSFFFRLNFLTVSLTK